MMSQGMTLQLLMTSQGARYAEDDVTEDDITRRVGVCGERG